MRSPISEVPPDRRRLGIRPVPRGLRRGQDSGSDRNRGHQRHGGHRRARFGRGTAGTGGSPAGAGDRRVRRRTGAGGGTAGTGGTARRSSTPTSCWRGSTPTERWTPRSARRVWRASTSARAPRWAAGTRRGESRRTPRIGCTSSPRARTRRPHRHGSRRRPAEPRTARSTPRSATQSKPVRSHGHAHAGRGQRERQHPQRVRPARRQDRHVRLHGTGDRRRLADRQPDRPRPPPRRQRARHRRFGGAPEARREHGHRRGRRAPAGNARHHVRRVGHRELESVLVDGSADAVGNGRGLRDRSPVDGRLRDRRVRASAATGRSTSSPSATRAAGVFDTTWATTGVFEKDLTGDGRPRPQRGGAARTIA